VRNRLSALEWWRALRYSGVSVISIVCTQVALLLGHAVFGLGAMAANVVAVSLAAVPAFLLNRYWVWELQGRSSLRREVVPFWGFTLVGLALSTGAVAAVAAVTTSTVAVSAANIGAFGALWVAKYLVLDAVVFAPAAAEASEAVAELARF
jgi:putative flippase GtrA